MGASSRQSLSLDLSPGAAFDAAERALVVVGGRISTSDRAAGTITAVRNETFVSRGETVTVRIEPAADGGCIVHIVSETVSELDWGRNAANVAHIAQALTGGLGLARPLPYAEPPALPAPVLDISPTPRTPDPEVKHAPPYGDEAVSQPSVCAIGGESGPVEPCGRCGWQVCAAHRRRSHRTGVVFDPVYVCEVCFQEEAAEAGAGPAQEADSLLLALERTAVAGRPANLWAALGTAISALLAVLLLSALLQSMVAFAFLLVAAAVAFYAWGTSVHWWSEEVLQAATGGRRRAIWLLATPGLLIGGATLWLMLLACRAVGAHDLTVHLDRRREQLLEAAGEAMNEVLNSDT